MSNRFVTKTQELPDKEICGDGASKKKIKNQEGGLGRKGI
jgi:hypothetical protein